MGLFLVVTGLYKVSTKDNKSGNEGAMILIDKIEGATLGMVRKVILEAQFVIRKSYGH